MQVFSEINENKNIAIALGFFDGIHIGHKKLINQLVQYAKQNNTKCAIVTFDKNPADYFNNEPTLNIQTYKDREIILENMGVNYIYELNFENFKEMSALEYLQDVLIKNFNPKAIVVGYNHTFGKDRSGNVGLLKKYSKQYDYECIEIPELKYEEKEEVSSTQIRKRIQFGHLNAAKALLGRNFSVRNSVIKGDKIARELGYPTANIIWPSSMVKLPHGVYFGYTQTNSKIIPALISWGTKPTLSQGKEEILEAHLYEFNQDLYGKIIKVIFVKKLRDEQKFANKTELRIQLNKDYSEFEKWVKLINKC